MNGTIDVLVSAGTAFVISAGGALGVVAGSGYAVNRNALIGSCIVGAISAAKDVRATLKMPPLSNGASVDAPELPKPTQPKPAGQNDISNPT